MEPLKGMFKPVLGPLNEIGFERTRRAVAALALSLFVFLYLFIALNMPTEQWKLVFVLLSTCYGVAFMSVAAEWFWGRWFATGLAWSGVILAVASMAQIGWAPVLALYGGLHGLVILMLAGKKMAERFDLQPAWRERYGMDDFGVDRLRKTVTRASASLPSVILWAVGPKPPGEEAFAVLTFATGALALAGLVGVVRLRAWGLLALGGAAVAMAVAGSFAYPHFDLAFAGAGEGTAWAYRGVVAGPALPILLLASAVAPFFGPTARFLARRR